MSTPVPVVQLGVLFVKDLEMRIGIIHPYNFKSAEVQKPWKKKKL
jgi:hypothetical protein